MLEDTEASISDLVFLGDIYRSAAISSPSMLSAVSPLAGFKASERPF